MTPISLRLSDDLVESLNEEADQADVSRSEYIRDTLKSRHDTDALREEVDELQSAYDDLEAERDRLQRQLAATNARQDDVDELVEYVEDELSYREAGLGTRMKWWLFGKEND